MGAGANLRTGQASLQVAFQPRLDALVVMLCSVVNRQPGSSERRCLRGWPPPGDASGEHRRVDVMLVVVGLATAAPLPATELTSVLTYGFRCLLLLLLCVCKDKKKHKKEKSHKKHKERKKDRDKGDGDDARVKAAKEFLKQQLAGEQACKAGVR